MSTCVRSTSARRPMRSSDVLHAGPSKVEVGALFHEHCDCIHRFLWWLTRDAAVTDELLQEAFLIAWKDRARLARRDAGAAWLRQTAFRLWRDRQMNPARSAKSTNALRPVRSESVPSVDLGSASSPVQRVTQVVAELPA